MPQSLSLVAFKPTIFSAYLFNNFVWRSFGYDWLTLAMDGKITPLAQQATTALSKSNFGNSHHQPSIKVEGSIDYGQVVKFLIPKLANPVNPGNETLIIPILLLTIHDSSFKDMAATASHVRGLVQLLMVCGPQRFQDQPLRSAFESCRAMLTTGMIISRRRCFLEEERWQTVPWELDPESKSPQVQLGDILIMVPGFLEDDDALRQDESPVLKENLIARIEVQLVKLFEWRWTWQAINHNKVSEIPASATKPLPSQLGQAFKTSLFFNDFELATEITLYNAVHIWLATLLFRHAPSTALTIIVSSAIIAASNTAYTDSTQSSSLSLPGSYVSLRHSAIEIGRIFEYQCARVHTSQAAAYWYLFPIALAYSVLEKDEEYRVWLRGMLDSEPITRGYASLEGQNETGFGFYLDSQDLRKKF